MLDSAGGSAVATELELGVAAELPEWARAHPKQQGQLVRNHVLLGY